MDLPKAVLLKLECYDDLCFFELVQRRYGRLYNTNKAFGWYDITVQTCCGNWLFNVSSSKARRLVS